MQSPLRTQTRQTIRRPSAPPERAVADRMQLARSVTRKPERIEEHPMRSEKLVGDEIADADHLVAVVRIGDHIDVVAETVEHREAVRREAADSARRLGTAVLRVLPLE